MPRSIYTSLVLLLALIGNQARAADQPQPFNTEKRVLWTRSTVVGSPDPPLPFRLRQTFTNVEIKQPVYIINEPGTNYLWVIQHLAHWAGPGKIIRLKNDPDVRELETILELDRLAYGMCFHPRYRENGYIYIHSNGPSKEKNKFNAIVRSTVKQQPKFEIDLDSKLVIIEWESNGHNGGEPAFGPDGMLYFPTGDGTSDSDTNDTGQDLVDLAATMIRIDVDHPDADRPYSIPKDNPFVNYPGARPEIWAYGFRNPWRMFIDHKTGLFWVGNNGQDLWEQVFLVERGGNYGWSVTEGSHPFHPNRKPGPTPILKPAIEHPHSEFRSLTGGVVYYGKQFPELVGTYIYGDFSTGRIWGARHDGKKISWNGELADTSLQITGFNTDEQGELLVMDSLTGIYRFERAPQDESPAKFPRKLSETGVFTSVPGHQVDPALIPYSVNAQLWSDGAYKERYIGLPGESQIEFTGNRGWKFDDGAVLVKSFALELEAGNPASRQWVETRLLTRQQGEWVGYSYRWNDEQTDADLVESAGADRPYAIRDAQAAGGTRQQVWHYPSRAECMVCHARAAQYTLGTSTLQMNRDHDYGGKTINQIALLDQLGIFKKSPGKKELPKLVDPYDSHADINDRARSYLHANCAICHVQSGGGNAAIEIEFTASNEKARIFDAVPLHHTFGVAGARIIAPGHPERSMMLRRVAHRGAGQMPPLATSLVDDRAVQMLTEWIAKMPPEGPAEGPYVVKTPAKK